MLVYGKNVAQEIIKAKRNINKVILKTGFNDNLVEELKKQGAKIEFLEKKVFEAKYPEANQGIVIDVEDYKYCDLDEELTKLPQNPLILMLDGIEDPQNFGAIIRSFDACGGSLIIVPKHRNVLLNQTVVKVSTGAINYVKVCLVTNLNQTIRKLKDNGFWIVGTDMNAATNYNELDPNMPLCVVIGSEGFGISNLVKQNCDYLVKIPMRGHVNSLNASVSAGIIMFDIMTRRK